jgi:hypothetical protein
LHAKSLLCGEQVRRRKTGNAAYGFNEGKAGPQAAWYSDAVFSFDQNRNDSDQGRFPCQSRFRAYGDDV